jgi:hypothetical protein
MDCFPDCDTALHFAFMDKDHERTGSVDRLFPLHCDNKAATPAERRNTNTPFDAPESPTEPSHEQAEYGALGLTDKLQVEDPLPAFVGPNWSGIYGLEDILPNKASSIRESYFTDFRQENTRLESESHIALYRTHSAQVVVVLLLIRKLELGVNEIGPVQIFRHVFTARPDEPNPIRNLSKPPDLTTYLVRKADLVQQLENKWGRDTAALETVAHLVVQEFATSDENDGVSSSSNSETGLHTTSDVCFPQARRLVGPLGDRCTMTPSSFTRSTEEKFLAHLKEHGPSALHLLSKCMRVLSSFKKSGPLSFPLVD